ncbi:MAG TPA: hypothetical protein VLB44_25970 [Kofleriaceae bacterium]|nr:hypothetical protein [Kofleriaceae bacterium]
MKPISREAIIERRQPFLRWSAIFGGAILGIGVWILLQVLGMGLGMSAVDTDDAGSLRAVGIGTGIFSIIAPLIAMFVGGALAGRLCGISDRKIGAIHGSVMWALGLAFGLWSMMSLVGALASGVGHMASTATTAVVSTAATAGAKLSPTTAMNTFGLTTNDLVAPINERLQREGKPPITAQQLDLTMHAIVQRGVREGQLDREVIVDELAKNTALSKADAQDIANDIQTRYRNMTAQVKEAADRATEQAKHAALVAADRTGKILLLGGIMMLLSLGAAVAGAALGVPRYRRVVPEPLVTDVPVRTDDIE